MSRLSAIAIGLLAAASTSIHAGAAFGAAVDEPAGVTTEGVRPLAPNHASVTIRMIDVHGAVKPAGRIRRLEWVWSRATADDPAESPALRVWLESDIPRKWTVRRVSGDGAVLGQPLRTAQPKTEPVPQPLTPEAPPEDFQPSPGNQVIVVDLRARQATLRLELTDERDRPQDLTLSATIIASRPYVLVRRECRALGTHLLVTKVESRQLFVGLSCTESAPGVVDTTFFRSQDGRWMQKTGLIAFDPENKYVAFKFRFAQPTGASDQPAALFKAGVADDHGHESEYSVYYKSWAAPALFFGHAGLLPTYTSMSFTRPGLNLSQYSINFRIGGGMHLIAGWLDASVDLNGDLISPWHSPSNLPQARFFGIDSRLALRLPFEIASTTLWVAGGWLTWGIDVANHVYGTRPLGGPELFVEARHVRRMNPGWTVWIKRATLAEPIVFSSGNSYEEAIGASYDLGPVETKPYAVTTDFRHDHSFLVDQNKQLDGYAFALGIMKPF